MQRDRFVAARTWLDNARTDFALALEVAERYPSRACFRAQQSAELALKAALIAVADDHPRTHVGDVLVSELRDVGVDLPADVVESANRLDPFYIGSRHPDALAGADPLQVLQSADAVAAAERTRTVCDFAAHIIDDAAAEPQAGDGNDAHRRGR